MAVVVYAVFRVSLSYLKQGEARRCRVFLPQLLPQFRRAALLHRHGREARVLASWRRAKRRSFMTQRLDRIKPRRAARRNINREQHHDEENE